MNNTDTSSWTVPSIGCWPGAKPPLSAEAALSSLRVWGPWLIAGLLFSALMFSFLSVVQQGVARAAQQQRLVDDRGRAEQRCQGEPSVGQRRACLADLQAASALASLR